MKTKDIIIIILVASVAILGTYIYMQKSSEKGVVFEPEIKEVQVNSFEDCVAAGNPVMANHPGKCIHNGKTFVEELVTEQIPSTADESGERPALIGGDKDEHGCLIAAGYSWCEEKEKCLRTWEEECEEDKEDAIISALADKHNKDESEVTITISEEEGDYVRGGVKFEPGGIGNAGMFLATKINGDWVIVYDGHGVADCDELLNTYGFPMSIITGMCEYN